MIPKVGSNQILNGFHELQLITHAFGKREQKEIVQSIIVSTVLCIIMVSPQYDMIEMLGLSCLSEWHVYARKPAQFFVFYSAL